YPCTRALRLPPAHGTVLHPQMMVSALPNTVAGRRSRMQTLPTQLISLNSSIFLLAATRSHVTHASRRNSPFWWTRHTKQAACHANFSADPEIRGVQNTETVRGPDTHFRRNAKIISAIEQTSETVQTAERSQWMFAT